MALERFSSREDRSDPATRRPFEGPRQPAERSAEMLAELRRLRSGAPATTADTDDTSYLRDSSDGDSPTNVYYLAHYVCGVTLNAIPMMDNELGLFTPRSGRVWLNVKLFTDAPRGRALAQRDAWWRAVDASPAVRFLLGWCVALHRVANFHGMARDQLPGWTRIFAFRAALAECPKARIQLWSDVAREVTTLFAPPSRIWRQAQFFAPLREGDRRWQARLALASQRVEDVLRYLADQNNCPPALIRRTLDGNPPLTSYTDYLAFTDALLEDLARLRMHRLVMMQSAVAYTQHQESNGQSRVTPLFKGRADAQMADPRYDPSFWRLHL